MKKTLFMETTGIEAAQTVAQIQALLGKSGAKSILTEYDKGEVCAVSFQVHFKGSDIPFRLPCRADSIEKILIENIKTKSTEVYYRMKCTAKEQAKRVAWRQVLRWIEAQLALVETEMVTLQEVFLPYMQTGLNQTLYQAIEKRGFNLKQLGHQS